ncbi:hypothetical protein DXG01_001167 [Tephrocybe rancida]|nr:hypothetical protein DXG01_001167 [Tephrocybe rancida]
MPSFAEFPLDVLVEVFQHLDWRDLLALRQVGSPLSQRGHLLKAQQVCASLNAPTRAHTVWTAQYKKYASRKKFRPLLEEPLEAYTSKELETLVLRRISADETWASETAPPAHERAFAIKDLDTRMRMVDPLYLVQGGRWLLVTVTKTGSVLAYDLDHARPAERVKIVIPPRENPIGEFQIVVEVDETAPRLTLRLASYPSDRSTPDGGQTMIWSVTLQGHGAGACLEAHLLKAFTPIAAKSYRFRVSLYGKLFARTLQLHDWHNGAIVEVYNWTLPMPSMHRKAIAVPRESTTIQTVHLLPANRIAAFSNTTVYIFDIEMELFSNLTFDRNGPIQSQWVLPLPIFGPHLDSCMWMTDDDASYTVLSSTNEKDSSSGLVIPHAPDKQPRLVELKGVHRPHWDCRSSYIGFGKALFDAEGPSFDLEGVDYSWDIDGDLSISRHRLVTLTPVIARLAAITKERTKHLEYANIHIMDEESGRGLFCFDHDTVVFDISRLIAMPEVKKMAEAKNKEGWEGEREVEVRECEMP